jgi:hypothetical protein
VKNIVMEVKGTVLYLQIDLTQDFGPSNSGKTHIVASTEGNCRIPNRQEVFGLNVYRKLNIK